MRVDDAVIDEPEHSEHKEKCMVAIRNCEASFTSYAGSVRSIKAVVDPAKPKNKPKSKAKAVPSPPHAHEVSPEA
ncbi:unnamed protein product [Durusdinium trenchii]|uniref:Uncharacterized protein n=1 Tax=Durusdinium trenchii TaxID=1381693 RepID=A0ABP0PIS7_9DINO